MEKNICRYSPLILLSYFFFLFNFFCSADCDNVQCMFLLYECDYHYVLALRLVSLFFFDVLLLVLANGWTTGESFAFIRAYARPVDEQGWKNQLATKVNVTIERVTRLLIK